MKFRLSWLALGLSSAFLTFAAHAEEGSAERGKVLAYTCHGCHGIENYKNVYPTYSVPKLGGQRADYIVAALKSYATGDRAHPTMYAHAASLSDQDIADIAAYLSAGAPPAPSESAGTPPAAAATCVACHGADGITTMPAHPNLAGQHRDYLEQAIKAYKSGKRKNAVMAGMAGGIKEEDIAVLARYYSSQKPAVCSTDKIRDKGMCK